MGRERRTNPGFLSDTEAARESRRIQDVVRGVTGQGKTAEQSEKSRVVRCFHDNESDRARFAKVGATESFVVDFDFDNKRACVYGKEIPSDCPYRIGMGMEETEEIVCLPREGKKCAQ